MRSIFVEPEELERRAALMENHNDSYVQAFTQLFSAVDLMEAGWKGRDNTAFSNQIHKFEADFRQMSALCTQYSEFLRSSALAYRETQDAIASQAAHLAQ